MATGPSGEYPYDENPAPERIRLIATTFRNGVWVWDGGVRREPEFIPYANAVEYVRADLVATLKSDATE